MGNGTAPGPETPQVEREIQATGRVFPEIGPGVNALKRDLAGLYYILASPASVISVYGEDGKRRASIPNANSKGAKIVYAEDIDLDATGRLFVADRGANAIRVFRADGSLDATIPASAPTSIAALPGGEFAVETQRSDRLVDIIDAQGKLVRAFGDPADLEGSAASNRFLSRGRLVGDSAGYIYFAFTYSADPTIRRYDRYGYASYEISLSAAEFNPEAEKRRDVLRLDRHTNVPTSKPVLNAIGVDPLTQEVWAAIGNALLHFSKDGSRLPTYRTVTKDGTRIEPKAILVEPGRILLAADPIGIFEFARPDKISAGSRNP
jgi:DNA-binding beta-propeller fold protein YncE